MRHYRLGNDLMLRVALFDVSAEGLRQPHSLTGEVSMIATTKLDSVKLTVSSVENNIITATFTGAEMRAEGVYTLTVAENHGEHSRTIDICHAFELVGCACEASGEVVSNDTTLDIESVVAMLPYAIDADLDPQSTNAVQNRAVAQAIDALATEIPDVSEFVTEATLTASLSGKVDKVEGKGLSTNDFDNEAKAEVAKVEGKQDKLIVSPLGNGNIKVEGIGEFMAATPSGNPNHNLYVSLGAVWSDAGWELHGVPLTNEEIDASYLCSVSYLHRVQDGAWSNMQNYLSSRFKTNFPSLLGTAYNAPQKALNANGIGITAMKLQVVRFQNLRSETLYRVYITNSPYMFNNSPQLREIQDYLDVSLCTSFNFAFGARATSLETIWLIGLKASIDFSGTPVLKKECLLYMIQKAAPTTAITIKVHPDVYDWALTDTDIQAALDPVRDLITLTA